jgi:hypothetical protein
MRWVFDHLDEAVLDCGLNHVVNGTGAGIVVERETDVGLTESGHLLTVI